MSRPIPEELRGSAGLQYIVSKGWEWDGPTAGQVKVESCPICHKGDYKFYMNVDTLPGSRDGLYMCFHGSCGQTGNLIKLKELLGDRIAGVSSRSDWAGKKGDATPDALPDVELCHSILLGDADALDYLINVRGFTEEVIRKQKLGIKEKQWFREAGETRALVYPYLVNDNIVYAKYRTLPPAPKDFSAPSGWEAPLYNGEILQEGIKEIIFVEGEANTVGMLSRGILNVVGVPGANVKKASWIEALDQIAPENIYIFYDNDKAGNKAAQDIASRIGIDRCRKLVLPEFTVTVPLDECRLCDDSGVCQGQPCFHRRLGKDFNEWFQSGHGTLEAFNTLKEKAKLFDVTGVTSSKDALEQLEDELNGKEDLAPSYTTQYPELNRLVGFEDGDIIDIVAPGKIGKTTFGLNLIDHMVSTYGEDGLVVCLEMTQARLARKWVSIVTGFREVQATPGSEEAKAKLQELKDSVVKAREIQQQRNADIYFAYPQLIKEPEDVYKLIRDCIRRYGVKWVMFDNLQRLCDDTLKSQGHRTIHLSQISKGFAKLAKDYKVKLIRIVQPKQIDQNEIITSRSVDGSSQIEKDCDAQILLWRKSLNNPKASQFDDEQETGEEKEEIFDPAMKVTVSLSRYSAGGWCWLVFDGACSTVRSKPKESKKNFNAIIGGIPSEPVAPPVAVPEEKVTI